MKKLILLFTITVAFYSCEIENMQQEISSNTEEITIDKTQEIIDVNRYFGIFSTYDSHLHGEIRIEQLDNSHFVAIVKLVNSKTLNFRGLKKKDSNLVEFHGEKGFFSIDFSENSDKSATSFLVDDKEGYIKIYKEPSFGGGNVITGTYIDSDDPSFTGNWDMLSFGAISDPNYPNFILIDQIIISHLGTVSYENESAEYQSFTETCVTGGYSFIGAASDGTLTVGLNQTAIFNGVATTWNMIRLPTESYDPLTCMPLGSFINGTWSRNGRSGTLSRF